MQSSKLIGLLKVLSEEELERFREYMQSPFFKKTTKVIALFEWIDAQNDHPTYRSSQLEVELIGKVLFPNQKNKTLRKKSLSVVSSELVGLIKDFLMQLRIERRKSNYEYILLEELKSRQLERDFWHNYKKSVSQQSKLGKNIEYYFNKYAMDVSCYYFHFTDKQLLKEKKKLGLDRDQIHESLDLYFILNKLHDCCFNWNTANILAEEKNSVFAHELIDFIESKQLNQIDLVNCYYLILLLLMYPDEETYFFSTKGIVEK